MSVSFRFIFFIQIFSLFTSCSDDPIILNNIQEDVIVADTSRTIIPFKTVSRWRSITSEYVLNTQFVLKSRFDRLTILDLPGSFYHIPEQSLAFWQDSMIVGIVYGKTMGIFAEFIIDSLILDSVENRLESYSHINDPKGDNYYSLHYFHFVKLPQYDQPLYLYQISEHTVPNQEDSIPFRTLFNKRDFLLPIAQTQTPFLALLKNESDQKDFLDSMRESCSGSDCFKFPDFAYGDSMLVGVIGFGISSSIQFSIISLINNNDVVEVNAAHIFFGNGLLADRTIPIHFIAIKNTDAEIVLNEVQYFGEIIE